MTRSKDPEWTEEKMHGEIPLDIHSCHFCSIKSFNLLKIEHAEKSFYSCSESYNSWLSELHYPDPPPTNLLQDEHIYPCYQSLEDLF
jgi:hypothetical protein